VAAPGFFVMRKETALRSCGYLNTNIGSIFVPLDSFGSMNNLKIVGRILPPPRPLLKWAGGKTQLLAELKQVTPRKYGKYIEPFFGGGALFFDLRPTNAIISDSNAELVNLYRSVQQDPDKVINELGVFRNDQQIFYEVRALNWEVLSQFEAAARTIYLNKTCFNGLYRVNRSGQFNVPFGRYKNPNLCPEDSIRSASYLLQYAKIVHADYLDVLKAEATAGDFVFLDPPYLPVSKYADFKRYTKEQFYEDDHRELATEVDRLQDLGCHVILTNSNHPLVHELYGRHKIEVHKTRRHISSKASTREGEDVIVSIQPRNRLNLKLLPPPMPRQVQLFPQTRYMGSKSKLLPQLWSVFSQLQFDSALDLFSGSGIVGYMLKAHAKQVISNDYMVMSTTIAKATIENPSVKLTQDDLNRLIERPSKVDNFVELTFNGIYFSNEDNKFIDCVRANIKRIRDPFKKALATAAIVRACVKKRPRGIFTFVGDRYDDGRSDLRKDLKQHFLEAAEILNDAVFDNGKFNSAMNENALDLKIANVDLVYIDPPYFSPFSDNEYVRRYHFVEGLARDWKGVEIQEHTITKKFRSYPTPFSSRTGAKEAFDSLFRKFADSTLVVSYSSNSEPTLHEMTSLLAKYKRHVDVVPVDYKYSFGNQGSKVGQNKNSVQEYIFVAT
jgi:DNA adenine methylase